MTQESKGPIESFLCFVAEVATVSHQEAIEALRVGDMDAFHESAGRTSRLSAVSNIDGKDRFTPVMKEARVTRNY